MTPEKFLDRVLFVIVVYKRRIQETEAWTSLSSELANTGHHAIVLMYDNSAVRQVVPSLAGCKVIYHCNDVNAGVAAAYNQGHRIAIEYGMQWLFLLDQDTLLPKGTLMKYADAIEKNPSQPVFAPQLTEKGGIISPFKFRHGRGTRITTRPTSFVSLENYKAINSGLLVSTNLFDAVGGYDESIPLDFSDIAFLEKVRKLHDKLFIVDVELRHRFSGTAQMDTQESIERFAKFCQGARMMQKKMGEKGLRLRSLLRALKLSLAHLNLRFLAIYFQTWSK